MTTDQFRTKIREITNTTTTDYSDASLIRDLNAELSLIQVMILRDRGVLEFDDVNYADLPIATLTMVASQSTYKLTEDDDSNKILTIHKVAVLKDGKYIDIPRVQVGEGEQEALVDASSSSVPSGYYEVGNSIVFSQLPTTGGTIKVWFDRDVDFLLTSDTTKIPGIPTQYHNLAAYRTAYNYALDKGLSNVDRIMQRVQREEEILAQFEANRRGDEATIMTVERVTGL